MVKGSHVVRTMKKNDRWPEMRQPGVFFQKGRKMKSVGIVGAYDRIESALAPALPLAFYEVLNLNLNI